MTVPTLVLAFGATAGSAMLVLLHRLSKVRQRLPPPRTDLFVAWAQFAEAHDFELTESLGTGVLSGVWRHRVARLTWSPTSRTVTVSSGLGVRLTKAERELLPFRLESAAGSISLLEDTLLLTAPSLVVDPAPLLEVTVDLAARLDELVERPWCALEELGLARVANRRLAGDLHGAEVSVQQQALAGAGPHLQLTARLTLPHSMVVQARGQDEQGIALADPILSGTLTVLGASGDQVLARLSDDAVRPLLLDLVHGRGARVARGLLQLTLQGLPDEHLQPNLEDLARLAAALNRG